MIIYVTLVACCHDLGADHQGGAAAVRRDLHAFAVLWHFGFSLEAMFAKAVEVHPKHLAIMEPAHWYPTNLAISLGLRSSLGTAGLPHILMRFFTVSDAKPPVSRCSCDGLIGYFYILTFIIGLAPSRWS